MGLFLGIFVLGCGAKTGLAIDPQERDGGYDGGVDAGPPPPIEVDAGVRVCPRPPCDCTLRGRLTWTDVAICAYAFSNSIGGCEGWADPVELETSCAGRYTVCARVESRAGCVIDDACGSRSSAGGIARIRIPGFSSENECAREAIAEHGVRVCMRVEWLGVGHEVRELGCFAYFGPWCVGPDCGGGGGGGGTDIDGDDGEWEF